MTGNLKNATSELRNSAPFGQHKKCRVMNVLRVLALLGLPGLAAYGVYASVGESARSETTRMAEATVQSADSRILDPAEVIEVRPRDLIESLPISGVVEPARRVSVSAEVSGIADDIHLLPGQGVRAGDPLLTIAEEDYRLALQTQEATRASLLAQIEAAESSLRRSTELAERGVISRSTLEEAQSGVAVFRANIAAADAQIRLARANLERARIYAPISGIVVGRTVEPGQLVQAGTILFDIIDLSRVTIEAIVPLDRLPTLSPGETAEFWLPQDPSLRFSARIERISPQAIDGTRSAMVYLGIDNVVPNLPAGLFLAGRIILREGPAALALPSQAITLRDDGAFVQIIREGRIAEIPVGIGAAWPDGDLVEVISGLSAGDRVLAMPLRNLAPGEPVRIAER